jgi:hypothetical protein
VQTRLPPRAGRGLFPGMSTLAEIEEAVEKLPEPEQETLLQHLSMRLRRRMRATDAGSRGLRLGKNPRTGLPLIRCAPGAVIAPTKEELGDF